ncbi:MAG: ATP-binding protein [Saprospiraceae bacterium]
MRWKPGNILNFVRHLLSIRNRPPAELEKEFIAFKDIKSIDRIEVSCWIAITLTVFMFGLDIYRFNNGLMQSDTWYPRLFILHFVGLLFLIPAIHISRNKNWIIQTRLRRGIVIWGMVVLTIVFLLGQSVMIYLQRGALVMFMGYIFVAGWMFAMSHKEHLLFNFFSLSIMGITIVLREENPDWDSRLNTNFQMISFIEVFFLSIIAYFFDTFDFQQKLENFMFMREIEKEQKRIRSLEAFKSKFFTNLTHEIRTPLTLISGMAAEIREDPKRWANEGSEIITRNSGNLLTLINQILDLSKIENGSLEIKMIKGDIVSYLGYIVDAFRGHAIARDIHLHFLTEEPEIIMDYDPDKYMTIMSNLLSNAIKFTPEKGNIYIQLDLQNDGSKSSLEITVRDTGIGIPPEALDHVFERFFQAENNGQIKGVGTGIGLSVVSELIKLLNGDIKVKSHLNKGTQFNITIPITTSADSDIQSASREQVRKDITEYYSPLSADNLEDMMLTSEERYEVLIIEDNPDVMKYLQVCLSDIFQLSFSTNGEDGIQKAIEKVPDLILSDVMMPIKDGLAVCRELKNNQVTSHIPIVLLSAKADPESRIAGLESGADVYFLKPFDKRELRAQLNTLLDQRRENQSRYADPTVSLAIAPDPGKAKEDEFVIRVRQIVAEKLDDSDFSVLHLCRAVYLSRTQLHKKLKALTGQSASLFIRQIRLYAAMDLLKTSDLSIAETAYKVGFEDPNYFSRSFAAEFGITPSETRNGRNIN